MSDIDIRRNHSHGLDKARALAEQMAERMKEKLGLDWSWSGDTIRFEGKKGKAKGVTGTTELTADSVRIQLKLPFLLRAMKSVIQGKIEERMDRFVAG